MQGPEVLYDVVGGRSGKGLQERGGSATVRIASSRVYVGQQRRANVQRYEAPKTIISLGKLIAWYRSSVKCKDRNNETNGPVAATFTKAKKCESSCRVPQNSFVSSSASRTMLMRKATVSFVAPSAIVRMTCTNESEGKLFVKS